MGVAALMPPIAALFDVKALLGGTLVCGGNVNVFGVMSGGEMNQFTSPTAFVFWLLVTVAPFMNQMAFMPLAVLRQRMSARPSASRSTTAAICQFMSASVSVYWPLVTVAPF